jgi:hypothetical protein
VRECKAVAPYGFEERWGAVVGVGGPSRTELVEGMTNGHAPTAVVSAACTLVACLALTWSSGFDWDGGPAPERTWHLPSVLWLGKAGVAVPAAVPAVGGRGGWVSLVRFPFTAPPPPPCASRCSLSSTCASHTSMRCAAPTVGPGFGNRRGVGALR